MSETGADMKRFRKGSDFLTDPSHTSSLAC